MRNSSNVELGAGYPEIVTLCRGGLDTLHANRTPHHQMKVLICSEMLLPLIMVAIALAFSSSQSLYLFSFFHHLVMLFLRFTLLLSPSLSLVDEYALRLFLLHSHEVLAQKKMDG